MTDLKRIYHPLSGTSDGRIVRVRIFETGYFKYAVHDHRRSRAVAKSENRSRTFKKLLVYRKACAHRYIYMYILTTTTQPNRSPPPRCPIV